MSCTEESFLRLISLTAQTMRNYADQRLKKYDLTVEQLQVLKHLDGSIGRPQRQLCHETGKSPANITRILDRLQKKNCIARKENPDDRRATLVVLTKEGEALKNEVITLFEKLGDDLVDGIEESKQQIVFEVLGTIKNRIENSEFLRGAREK